MYFCQIKQTPYEPEAIRRQQARVLGPAPPSRVHHSGASRGCRAFSHAALRSHWSSGRPTLVVWAVWPLVGQWHISPVRVEHENCARRGWEKGEPGLPPLLQIPGDLSLGEAVRAPEWPCVGGDTGQQFSRETKKSHQGVLSFPLGGLCLRNFI